MRYRNVNSGAIVDVRDDKVMDAEWEQAASKPAPKKASAKSDSSK
jgi:hypothetical protein